MRNRKRDERGVVDVEDVLSVLFWIVVIVAAIFGIVKWVQHSIRVSDEQDAARAAHYAATHDKHVYTITGTLLAKPSSLVRQTKAAHGEISGGMVGGVGGISGKSEGAKEAAKNFVRLAVSSATPSVDLAQPGGDALLKAVDTKTIALDKDDQATFACLRQYEHIGTAGGTWELDDCRVVSFRAAS